MAERKRLETKAQPQVPKIVRAADRVMQSTGAVTIGVNKHVITYLAIYGPQNRAEALLREVHRTLKRIGLRTGRGVKPFAKPEKGGGGSVNMHDAICWLDSLHADHVDVGFLRRLYKTLCGRVTKGFLNDLGKDPHGATGLGH